MDHNTTDAASHGKESQADPLLQYYERTKNGPPSPFLLAALPHVSAGGDALDLGCGALNDTRELLNRGFRVTAVDRHPAVAHMAKTLPQAHLVCVISTFADFQYGSYDLVNARFSLPFNPPASFEAVFAKVMRSIKPGGMFTGELFGNNDSWNTPDSPLTFHTHAQVERVFNDNRMRIVELITEEEDRHPVVGPLKHWHIFHITARKSDE